MFYFSSWKYFFSLNLIFNTKHAMNSHFRNSGEIGERSVFTLYTSSAYPPVCGVQREADFDLNSHFFALVSRQSTAFNFATQHAMLQRERSVLALSSICLPCCVRDTAWMKLIIYYHIRRYLDDWVLVNSLSLNEENR